MSLHIEKAMTLAKKFNSLRALYSKEKKYRQTLEGTIYSLQDRLEEQQRASSKFAQKHKEIMLEHDKLQQIYRQESETAKSTREGLEHKVVEMQEMIQGRTKVIERLERDVQHKTKQIDSDNAAPVGRAQTTFRKAQQRDGKKVEQI